MHNLDNSCWSWMSISVTPNYAVLLLLYIYFHFKSPCVALTNCFRGLIPVKVRVSNSDQVPDSDHIFCWSVSSIGWAQKLKRWHWITPKSDGNLCQNNHSIPRRHGTVHTYIGIHIWPDLISQCCPAQFGLWVSIFHQLNPIPGDLYQVGI